MPGQFIRATGGAVAGVMHGFTARLRESLVAFGGSFRNRNLRRLQLAFAGSELGSWGYWIALSVMIFESSGAKGLGLLTAVLLLGPAIASPFTSVLGDRFDRVSVMLSADLLRTALMALAAVVAFADWSAGILYGIAAISGIVGSAFRPAEAAILPQLARTPAELTAANVASSTIESVTAFAGPAIGGVIVAVADPGVSFAIAAGTFLWSALLIAGIRRPDRPEEPEQEPGAERERLGAEITAGARMVVHDSRARLLVGLLSAQTLLAGALLVLVPVIALDLLDWGPEGIGALEAALGIGGLVGAGIAIGLVGMRRLSTPFGLGTVVWGAPVALIAVWDTRAGAIALLGIVGVANTVVDVAGNTMLQRAVPNQVLARVFGVLESLIYATTALGGIIAAMLIESVSIEVALVVGGVFLPLTVLLLWPGIVRLDREAPLAVRALELVRGVPFLASLPPAVIEGLAAQAIDVTVPGGQAVFHQGDRGDRFYLISSGQAQVVVDGEPRPPIGPGESFGEIALLRDIPRTASVLALSDLELVALERDEFIAAVTGHAPSHEAAGAVVRARLTTGVRTR